MEYPVLDCRPHLSPCPLPVGRLHLVKAKSGGERERKDFLNMPPRVLLHALAQLQAEHVVAGSKLPALLKDMWRANPLMAKSIKSSPGFVHQGCGNDRLFKASYKTQGAATAADAIPMSNSSATPGN